MMIDSNYGSPSLYGSLLLSLVEAEEAEISDDVIIDPDFDELSLSE